MSEHWGGIIPRVKEFGGYKPGGGTGGYAPDEIGM